MTLLWPLSAHMTEKKRIVPKRQCFCIFQTKQLRMLFGWALKPSETRLCGSMQIDAPKRQNLSSWIMPTLDAGQLRDHAASTVGTYTKLLFEAHHTPGFVINNNNYSHSSQLVQNCVFKSQKDCNGQG
ncbi:hypothetical protein BYT27DRAFT_7240413 [Phlegmacium glaucopus]|nr:hypothetical protein BYT27DRAFT_7240413 [Phlegmacium glaucopus]